MKKVMGLDLGDATLGIAFSDTLGIAAHGFENFRFKKKADAVSRVLELVNQMNIETIVLGMPYSLKGEKTEGCKRSEDFKQKLLEQNKNLNVILLDERFTTVIASQRMHEMNLKAKKQKGFIDMQSAVVILESFMNSKEFQDGRGK